RGGRAASRASTRGGSRGPGPSRSGARCHGKTRGTLGEIMFDRMRRDVRTVKERDPAARSTLEVILCYPGVHAIWIHRPGHWLWSHGWFTLARLLSHVGRFMTGIEI